MENGSKTTIRHCYQSASLFCMCYLLSCLRTISYNADVMDSIALAWLVFIGTILFRNNRGGIWWLYELSGYAIVIFGFLNLFGQHYYPNAIWFTSGQNRLASVFQYSNTYAGYLLALLLTALYYTVHVEKAWRLLHAMMLVPIWVSLLLTFFPRRACGTSCSDHHDHTVYSLAPAAPLFAVHGYCSSRFVRHTESINTEHRSDRRSGAPAAYSEKPDSIICMG